MKDSSKYSCSYTLKILYRFGYCRSRLRIATSILNSNYLLVFKRACDCIGLKACEWVRLLDKVEGLGVECVSVEVRTHSPPRSRPVSPFARVSRLSTSITTRPLTQFVCDCASPPNTRPLKVSAVSSRRSSRLDREKNPLDLAFPPWLTQPLTKPELRLRTNRMGPTIHRLSIDLYTLETNWDYGGRGNRTFGWPNTKIMNSTTEKRVKKAAHGVDDRIQRLNFNKRLKDKFLHLEKLRDSRNKRNRRISRNKRISIIT